MKKIYSFLAMALISMMAVAQNMQLPGQLTVTVDGSKSQQKADVFFNIHEDEDVVDFNLPNFTLIDAQGNEMAVGNITIPNITITEDPQDEDLSHFTFNGNIQITAGDDPNKMWMGPYLGDVPLEMKGSFNDKIVSLVVDIDINMVTLGQIIKVNFTSETNTLAFTDQLSVDVDGSKSEQTTTVYLKMDDETETNTFVLPNFVLIDAAGNVMPVGNIEIPGFVMEELTDDIYTFDFNGDIEITAGDDSQPFWMGPMLGPVPVKLQGFLNWDTFKMYVTISIDMVSLQQKINVTFGENFIEGIRTLRANKKAHNLTYGLDGRQVNKDVKGIKIIDGNKRI